MQMMQQLTGINFILYFGTIFFQSLGTIKNPFLITLITTLCNVCSTPVSFYLVEKFGRRKILVIGGSGMVVSQFIIGIVGVTAGKLSNQYVILKLLLPAPHPERRHHSTQHQ